MTKRTDYLHECRRLFEDKLLAKFGAPIGATEFEICELEKEMGVTFPVAYRQYLLWMGKDKNGPLKGSEWFIDDLRENQEFLIDLLAENGVTGVSVGKKLCFFSHQGYMAAWFLAFDAESDPICEFYSEADPKLVAGKAGTFSQFLFKELSGVAENLRRS